MAEPTFAPVAKALHEAFETFDRRGGPADASFEALVALCDAVSDGAERCVPFGAFDVARTPAARAALVAPAAPASGRRAAACSGAAPSRTPARRAVAAADAAADGEIHAVLLFRRRADAEALPEAPRPWMVCTHRGFRVAVEQLEDQAPDANVRSMRSNAHHPAFFRVHDAVDRESDDSSVSDDEAGVTYDQYVRKTQGIHRTKDRPEDRYLTHVTLTFDDDVAACARAVAGDTVDAALAALPDLERATGRSTGACSASGPTGPNLRRRTTRTRDDGKDHRTPEKKMQDAVMAQMGMY
ncbi:hypothetical protein JL721_13051 [Aureococcus anophagefferens]|nr:hypothetical protein JL721_13051 [Aureococcus anophagefferens]